MARYQPAQDAPNQLRYEAQQIILTYTKTGPTTGRVSWNIPAPAIGCSEDNQSYNGIVITFDNVAASLSTTPTNKTVYTGDNTASSSLHAGDTIGTSLVVGSFYDDKLTTFIDISNITANTPVYISGYAVDKQLRYHREGVHAYSLSTGTESPNKREKLPSYQHVLLGLIDNSSLFDLNLYVNSYYSTGANINDPTGLTNDATTYTFNIKTDCKDDVGVTITIVGSDAQTFGDLVNAINLQFRLLENPPQFSGRPSLGAVYWNNVTKVVYIWNGNEHIAQPTIALDSDPWTLTSGEYWLKESTGILSQWSGSAWNVKPYIVAELDPTNQLTQSTYWYDGVLLNKWNGVVWCNSTLYESETDPSKASYPEIGSYWYNTITKVLYMWKEDCSQWIAVDVIYDPVDPELITTGDYWFNYETQTLYIYNSGNFWAEATSTISATAPTSPAVGALWINDADKLFKWSGSAWDEQLIIVYHLDPTDRESCQLWWETNTYNLYAWTYSSPNGWVSVTNFTQSPTDPTAVPTLSSGVVWHIPSDNTFYVWDGIDWNLTDVLESSHTPNTPLVGDVWYNPVTNIWKEWTGSWTFPTPFLISEIDTNSQPVGTYWYNTTTTVIREFGGSPVPAWNPIPTYSSTPYTPAEGYVYFDTSDEELYEWSGGEWITATPIVITFLNEQGNLTFITGEEGGLAFVLLKDGTLFSSLTLPFRILRAEPGRDEIPDVQGYGIEGIGSDGSSDERKQLITYIMQRLGYPSINVELTQEQLDNCVRKALDEFRLRSASAYKRGFFFLNIVPGKQIYELSNKTVGFNTISRVMAAYRMQSSFLGNAAGQGAYGQAMLQHLYQMGSFDLVSYHIMSDYVELMNMMFAANLVFTFDEDNRKLFFHQTFGSNERVLLDVIVERTEQEIIKDRICKVWIEKFATGYAMLMLAEIRGKFSTLPGAGGGVTLNSSDMRTAGQELIDQCYTDIEEYIASEIENIGIGADLVIG